MKLLNGIVERDEQEVTCVLDNGYKLRFFVLGLSDEEYIQRTNYCNIIEKSKIKPPN